MKLDAKYSNLLLFYDDTFLVTFIAIVFVNFVDTISITENILSHEIANVSAITNARTTIQTIIFFALMVIFTITLTCFIIPFFI